MKSIKILALIVGAITLLPSASFAENVVGNTQEANIISNTTGNRNLSVTSTDQRIINLGHAGRTGTNVAGTNQTVNAAINTVGDCNTIVQTAIQKAKNGLKAN
jgi:hypothetical protein